MATPPKNTARAPGAQPAAARAKTKPQPKQKAANALLIV